MRIETYKSVILPLVFGTMLIGLNLYSERWAASMAEVPQGLSLKIVPCEEGITCKELSNEGELAQSFNPNNSQIRIENDEVLDQWVNSYDSHNYFPAEYLLIGIVIVGVIISMQKSENPYLTILIVASILGIIRGIQSLNVYAPFIYFVVIGIGFGIGSVLLKLKKSA